MGVHKYYIMSNRHRRTRIYGANYDIGESYYKKQLNELDNKAGSHRNINGFDTLNENKLIPKVSFLCSDSDFSDNHSRLSRCNINTDFEEGNYKNFEKLSSDFKLFDDLDNPPRLIRRKINPSSFEGEDDFETTSRLMRRKIKSNNFDDANDKTFEKALTDFKHFDDFDQFTKSTSKLRASENKVLRNESPDALIKSYRKYAIEKEESPISFSKKADVSVSVRAKYLSGKERSEDNFEASQRINATKARLQDLEEEMSTIAKKQSEREKRNLNLKKVLSSTSNSELVEN
ncbi:uncharacterized protein ACRADG_003025 isoform 2-T2 [Cochliomyia hominivorax]